MRYKSPIFDPANAALDLLSRIRLHSSLHDTGFVSAFRPEYDQAQNEQRDRWLKAFLVEKGYYLLAVKGSIQIADSGENQQKCLKQFYFVTDWSGKKNLKRNLRSLGKEFGQEYILFNSRNGNTLRLMHTTVTTPSKLTSQISLLVAKDSCPTDRQERCFCVFGPILSVAYAGNSWTRYLASKIVGTNHT